MQRIDHDSALGRWTLCRQRPRASLLPYVSEIQGFSESGGQTVVRTELPSCIVPLIIILGSGFSVEDDRQSRPLRTSFTAGLSGAPVNIGSSGEALCLQADLTPLGAMRLLGPSLADLFGKIVNLDDIDGLAGERLEDQLSDLDDWPSRLALLEDWLARRLLDDRTNDRRLEVALAALGGNRPARVAALADRLGMSRKHLHGLFRNHMGLSPSSFLRLARFSRAAADLKSGPRDLADTAFKHGFADQAHFTRDFRAFSGMTPTRFVAANLADGTGLMADR